MNRLRPLLAAFLLFLVAATASAAVPPLTPVAADSVVVWGDNINDLRGYALEVDQGLAASPIVADKAQRSSCRKVWKKQILPLLQPFGLQGEEGKSTEETNCLAAENAFRLHLLTGHAEHMDFVERTLWNALLSSVHRPGPSSFNKHLAAQTLVDAMQMVYTTRGEDLFVNLFTNSTTHVLTPKLNVVVDQLTALPLGGRLKLRLSNMPADQRHVRLHVRIPQWATATSPSPKHLPLAAATTPPAPMFYVNGKEFLTGKVENGYYVVDRTWNNGDEILVDFPLLPFLYRPAADAKRTYVQCGPLVFAAPTDLSPSMPLTFSAEDDTPCLLTPDGNALLPYYLAGE
jgi:hypothetical protein